MATSAEIHEKIQNARACDPVADQTELIDTILDIQFEMLGHLQLLTRAILELDQTAEESERPCLTIGSRNELREFDS